MSTVTLKNIFQQLKADLIGKDSYRGVSLTYAWMANQFGHFSLGFIPALLGYSLLKKFTSVERPALIAALIVSGAWLLFELYNFLGPLLLQRKSKSNLVYVPERKYQFSPSWGNIAFDTSTDVCFFCFGAFSANLFLAFSWPHAAVVAGIFLLVSYPVYYWYLTRIYLQTARYPVQFRLSQWDAKITDADRETVLDFVKHPDTGRHLFVYGPNNSGKTSLAVGIATEISNKHKACTYTTAMKLYCLFFEPGEASVLWNWRTAAVMVIDDINPGDPVIEELVTPAIFLRFLDTFVSTNEENRKVIKNKNIIWVLGNKADGKAPENDWGNMLREIGVPEKNILSVNLLQNS